MSFYKTLLITAILAILSGCALGGLSLTSIGGEKKDFKVVVVPSNSFGGYIMNEASNTCSYRLELDGKCGPAGVVGPLGAEISYKAAEGAAARVFGYCNYEGLMVPVQAKFTVGQSFQTLYIGAEDVPVVGIPYNPTVERESDPISWEPPADCH